MTEEDPDLLAGDNLDRLRGRNPYSERFRLTEELENARYENNLLAVQCRHLEQRIEALKLEVEATEKINTKLTSLFDALRQERDEARREICNMVAGKQGKKDNCSPDAIEHASLREWDCFNIPASQLQHTLKGFVSEKTKAQPPEFQAEE